MKKAKGVPDELRAEYKRSDFGKLERGKYFERVKASSNVIVLEAEVAAVFPNSASVNKALYGFVEVAQKASGPPRRSTAKRALTPFLERFYPPEVVVEAHQAGDLIVGIQRGMPYSVSQNQLVIGVRAQFSLILGESVL